MSDHSMTMRRSGDVAWALGAAGFAVVLWGTLTFAPALGMLAAGLVFFLLLATLVRQMPVAGLVVLVGAAALDVMGRLGKVGPATITLYQAVAAAMAVYVLWRIRNREAALPGTPMDLPLALFALLAATSVPGAAEPRTALVTFVSLASSAVLLYLVVALVDTPKKAALLVWGTLAVAAVLGVMAVLERREMFALQPVIELWRYGIRARVTFKDPNILGSFLVAAITLAAPFALRLRSVPKIALAGVAGAAAMAGLAATLSRGAMVALVLSLAIVLLFARIPAKVKVVLFAGAGAVLAAYVLRVLDPMFVQTKILGVLQNRSFLQRYYLARVGWDMFRDYPLGIGLGNFAKVAPTYRQAYLNLTLVESHTAYITVLAETGLAGLLAFLWLLWRFVRSTFAATLRAADDVQALALGALAAGLGLMAQSLTYSLELSKFLWLTFGLGMAAVAMYRSSTRGKES